jgi:hypothetical protein
LKKIPVFFILFKDSTKCSSKGSRGNLESLDISAFTPKVLMLNTLNQASCSNEQKSGETNLSNLETSLPHLKIQNESNIIQNNNSYKNEKQLLIYRMDENYKLKKNFSLDYLKKLSQDLKKERNLNCFVKGSVENVQNLMLQSKQ